MSANTATGAGGIQARAPGKVSLNNVTVGDNQGGGVAAEEGATLAITNTLIAQNKLDGKPADCAGGLMSGGFNLIENTAGCTILGNTTGNRIAVAAERSIPACGEGEEGPTEVVPLDDFEHWEALVVRHGIIIQLQEMIRHLGTYVSITT